MITIAPMIRPVGLAGAEFGYMPERCVPHGGGGELASEACCRGPAPPQESDANRSRSHFREAPASETGAGRRKQLAGRLRKRAS
jgi:hypothetical protein